jgi:Ca-activated chloride channel family protein
MQPRTNRTAQLAAFLAVAALALPAAAGERVRLDVSLGTPVMLAGQPQTAYLKIGLSGFPIDGERRTPANVAIVIDRSGSMAGEKLARAKDAAIMAIDRLGPEDIVSVIAYDHDVDVVVPATYVRQRGEIYRRIQAIREGGNTALFAGVAKGAREVRRFADTHRVNRVILLSDGLANVGPSSPGELADLGWSLSKEGISVTTIGLGHGYNEDLMVALARMGDGNHAFVENAADLARVFGYEFGDVLSVVAREVEVTIRCAPGVRPLRVLGRPAEIYGGTVVARLNQLYASQEKFLMIEVQVPARLAGSRLELASVDVRYANTLDRTTDVLGAAATVGFSASVADVERSRNDGVLVASVELLANETSKRAVELRDLGRVAEAERLLDDNASFLENNARKYKSERLEQGAVRQRAAKPKLADPHKWNAQRKEMRDDQFQFDMQQAF